jgi:hypothetical protein
MFTLFPRVGVELPHRAGMLRFGMSEREAQWLVSTLADVREGWICGWAWAFDARYGDLTISVSGGSLPEGPATGLEEIGFERHGNPIPTTPADVPIVWNDIDLFGYPIPEVEEALTASRHRDVLQDVRAEELGLTLSRPAVATRPPGAALSRKPRNPATEQIPAAMRYLVSAKLSHPERRRSLIR